LPGILDLGMVDKTWYVPTRACRTYFDTKVSLKTDPRRKANSFITSLLLVILILILGIACLERRGETEREKTKEDKVIYI
jgi:hypothetical protein